MRVPGAAPQVSACRDDLTTTGLYDIHPDRLRPVLPCFRSAFDALTAWVDRGTTPPADHTIGRPADGDVVNSCALAGTAGTRR